MENNNNKKIRVAITHGDMNGIGYEVILKTFSDARMMDVCTPVLYGSTKVATYHKKLLSQHHDIVFNTIRDAAEASERKFNIINLTNDEVKIDIGKSTEIAGLLSRLALDMACEDLKEGKVDVLVTAPINKKNIQSADFDFPGHTEYLSHKFGGSSLMMMVCDRIRIGIVTNLCPGSAQFQEGNPVGEGIAEGVGNNPGAGNGRIEVRVISVLVGIHEGGRPVVTSGEFQENLIAPGEGYLTGQGEDGLFSADGGAPFGRILGVGDEVLSGNDEAAVGALAHALLEVVVEFTA